MLVPDAIRHYSGKEDHLSLTSKEDEELIRKLIARLEGDEEQLGMVREALDYFEARAENLLAAIRADPITEEEIVASKGGEYREILRRTRPYVEFAELRLEFSGWIHQNFYERRRATISDVSWMVLAVVLFVGAILRMDFLSRR